MKIVFIDTNIIIECAFQEVEGSNFEILKTLLEKLDNNEIKLLLPEIIENEINIELQQGMNELESYTKDIWKKFKAFASGEEKPKATTNKIKKGFPLITQALEGTEKKSIKNLNNEYKKIKNIIAKIIKHKNTVKIKTTDKQVIKAIKRAFFKKAPAYNPQKNNFTKDQDSLAFEGILEHLKKSPQIKKRTLIICCKDSDYFDTELKESIQKELDPLCKNLKGYQNILEMLKKELKEKYTKEEIKNYDAVNSNGGVLSVAKSLLNNDPNSTYTGGDKPGALFGQNSMRAPAGGGYTPLSLPGQLNINTSLGGSTTMPLAGQENTIGGTLGQGTTYSLASEPNYYSTNICKICQNPVETNLQGICDFCYNNPPHQQH